MVCSDKAGAEDKVKVEEEDKVEEVLRKGAAGKVNEVEEEAKDEVEAERCTALR